MPKSLFNKAELDVLDLARSILASRKMIVLKRLMSIDPNTDEARRLRNYRDIIDKALDNNPNWRSV